MHHHALNRSSTALENAANTGSARRPSTKDPSFGGTGAVRDVGRHRAGNHPHGRRNVADQLGGSSHAFEFDMIPYGFRGEVHGPSVSWGAVVFVVLAIGFSVTACGDDGSRQSSGTPETTSTPVTRSHSDVTHTFDGRAFTCEEALGVDPSVGCSDEVVAVWEEWGDRLSDYVDSGMLGPLNDEQEFSFEDAAYAGVIACSFRRSGDNEQDFIDYMQDPANNTQLDYLSGTELLPAWFAAERILCPGFTSGDFETP